MGRLKRHAVEAQARAEEPSFGVTLKLTHFSGRSKVGKLNSRRSSVKGMSLHSRHSRQHGGTATAAQALLHIASAGPTAALPSSVFLAVVPLAVSPSGAPEQQVGRVAGLPQHRQTGAIVEVLSQSRGKRQPIRWFDWTAHLVH